MNRPESAIPTNSICDRAQLPRTTRNALNVLSQHFASVCSTPPQPKNAADRSLDDEIQDAMAKTSPADELFRESEVKKACANIKRLHAAVGPDCIPAQFLKHLPPAAISALTLILN